MGVKLTNLLGPFQSEFFLPFYESFSFFSFLKAFPETPFSSILPHSNLKI